VTVFFTSDTHFGDSRVLRIDQRPFASIAEHDASLIVRWNRHVGPGDIVWHLGDFARGKAAHVAELLGLLNGTKHLIIGNNDGPDTLRCSLWASVQHYAELALDGKLLILCHYPFRTWNHMGRRSLNLHGHSHGRLKPMTRQFDMGVDAWEYQPVTLAAALASRRRPSGD
jgi:calcineurin-like phosphoesterase family protein